jgi:hypothetical protein
MAPPGQQLPTIVARSAGLGPVIVFRLQRVPPTIYADNRRVAVGDAADKGNKHALVPDFLAEHASRCAVPPTPAIRISDCLDQLMREHVIRRIDQHSVRAAWARAREIATRWFHSSRTSPRATSLVFAHSTPARRSVDSIPMQRSKCKTIISGSGQNVLSAIGGWPTQSLLLPANLWLDRESLPRHCLAYEAALPLRVARRWALPPSISRPFPILEICARAQASILRPGLSSYWSASRSMHRP